MHTPHMAAVAASEKDDPTLWRVDDVLWKLLEPVLRVDKPRRKSGRPPARRPGHLRRADLAGPHRGAVVPGTAGVRPHVNGPRARHGVDRDQGAGAGLGGTAARVRRRQWSGRDVALGRRRHRQGSVRQTRGPGEAQATGRTPTDRGKPGPKRHLLTDGRGIPAAVLLSGANRHDMKKLAESRDATVLEPAPTEPPHLALERGDDTGDCRDAAAARGDTAHLTPKASEASPLPPPGHPDRHPPRRWVVEVTHAWFNRFQRLLTRWEKRAATYLGFVHLAAVLIIDRKVRHARSLSG